jgi:Rieske Fe-S protein
MEKISKRNFIKLLFGFILFPFIYLIGKLISIEINSKERLNRIVEIPNNFTDKITFWGDFIVINQKNSLQIYSSKCTHLGCKINKIDNDKLLCPCHGSAYSFSGKVLNGPANRNLTKLDFKTDIKNKKIIVLINESL